MELWVAANYHHNLQIVFHIQQNHKEKNPVQGADVTPLNIDEGKYMESALVYWSKQCATKGMVRNSSNSQDSDLVA